MKGYLERKKSPSRVTCFYEWPGIMHFLVPIELARNICTITFL